MSDYIETSAAHGLVFGEFQDLTEDQRKKIVRLMSRVMERAYRRGVQQAVTFERMQDCFPDIFEDDSELHDWRYDIDLDKSVGIDEFETSSLERLNIEERYLGEIGLL